MYTGPDCECERWRDGAVWCLVHGVARPLAWQPSYTADAIQVADPEPEMFTTEWRTLQVQLGLEALNRADDVVTDMPLKMYWVAVAQAYFQAANIRSRPGESARKDKL
jgi:hypothetical protein